MNEVRALRLNYPYTAGVMLAVNAIADAYLVEDGPGCHIYRAMAVHGRHDWTSTLLSATGRHRAQNSGVNIGSIATKYEGIIREALLGAASAPRARVVLLSSLSMCSVAGTDYARVIKDAAVGKPVFLIGGASLNGDWLDGWAQTLQALAAGMDLDGGAPDPDAVAVVGLFADRGEGDHRGNAMEVRRLLSGIGLRVESVWLCGEGYEGLRGARRAGAVVSLPHARKAAATLATRLGARLVETGLPFGIDGTRRWLEEIALATGRRERAEAFVASELDELIPRIEPAVAHVLSGRRLVFVGDPHLLEGWRGLADEAGLRLDAAFFTAAPRHAAKAATDAISAGVECEYEPSGGDLRARWESLHARGADVLIASSDVLTHLRYEGAVVEFGFPSQRMHFLRETPFLGFRGAAALLERLANTVERSEEDRCGRS